MIVWPFIVMTLGLTVGLGYLISTIERQNVMQNWASRRCQLPIMAAASYFKPENDTRSPGQFSRDNFSFCVDELVKNVTSEVLSPLMTVFGKQGYIVNGIIDVLNAIRYIIKTIYDQFMSFITDFFMKYQAIANQARTTMLHLKAAFQRANTVVLSFVFMGLSIIKGITNSVDFIIKVTLIIMGIMIAIIIILFFILFPFIPLILSVIAAIVAVATGAVAGQAAGYRSGFCFSPNTTIIMKNGTYKSIKDIQIGDELHNGSVVESVLKMSGKNVPLWIIEGIYVSGTHLVENEKVSDTWNSVETDIRSKKTHYTEGYLYCLNTTNHIIPVLGHLGKKIQFRDWEEIREYDIQTHYQWNYNILEFLNKHTPNIHWLHYVDINSSYPSLSPVVRICTPDGQKAISEIKIGDYVLDEFELPTEVLGVIETITEVPNNNTIYWSSNMLYKLTETNVWARQGLHIKDIVTKRGYNIITESGTFLAQNADQENTLIAYRDFTEVGHRNIEQINICVEHKLRIPQSSQ